MVHPKLRRYGDKEIRELIKWFEEHGWTAIPPIGPGYASVRCPCGSHQKQIHKTPSGARYLINTRKWGQRQTCWK